jgi:hypothetical protein
MHSLCVEVKSGATPVCPKDAALNCQLLGKNVNVKESRKRNGYPRRLQTAPFTQLLAVIASRFAGRSAKRTPPITRIMITSLKFLWTL